MVSERGVSRTKELAGHLKDLAVVMGELQRHRKLCHKNFKHKDHGGEVQLLMWCHDQDGRLCAVICSTDMSQLKEVMPVGQFFREYTSSDTKTATLMQTEGEMLERQQKEGFK